MTDLEQAIAALGEIEKWFERVIPEAPAIVGPVSLELVLTRLSQLDAILRALPPAPVQGLTREKLDALIAQTEPDRCANCEHAGMVEAGAAMDGLRDYPTSQPLCDYHQGIVWLRDAILATTGEPEDEQDSVDWQNEFIRLCDRVQDFASSITAWEVAKQDSATGEPEPVECRHPKERVEMLARVDTEIVRPPLGHAMPLTWSPICRACGADVPAQATSEGEK